MRISERLAHKRPVFSFEFFPPKSDAGEAVLWRSLEHLVELQPDFVSVTWGAGGSTRERTLDVVTQIRENTGIEAMAHLTCVGASKDELRRVLDTLGERGVQNIFAVRGDPPKGETEFQPAPDGLRYGSELVAFIKDHGDFCVGAACYPEGHPAATDADADLRALKIKADAGADFLITQLFFDNELYTSFCARALEAGIGVPIIPGIMPVTNTAQLKRFTKMCGSSVPKRLLDRLEAADGDPHEVFWTGVSYAAHQCRALVSPPRPGPFTPAPQGAPGVHFYTLNRSPAARAIFEILRLSHAAN